MEDKSNASTPFKGMKASNSPHEVTENQQQNQELPNIFRVGDIFYERITKYDIYGRDYIDYEPRKKDTMVDKYGRDRLKEITIYDAPVILPSHTNFRQIVGNCVNMYKKLDFEPQAGQHPCTDRLLAHIFGDSIALGLDYLTILWRYPTQPLPVLCLVSKENHTGKSTFGNFLQFLFGRNVGFYSQSELSSSFNPWATSLVAVFEEISDAKTTLNKVKAMSTAQNATINEKYKAQYSFHPFVKIVILTNNDRDFIKATQDDIRYWIIRIKPLKKEDFLPDFTKNLREEIPAFMHTLNTREISVPNKSRMWFDPDLLKTDILQEIIENTQSEAAKEIRLWSDEILEKNGGKVFGVNLSELQSAIGTKFTMNQLKSALTDELKVPYRRTTYRNHQGFDNNGKAYFFGKDDIITTPDETDNIPF